MSDRQNQFWPALPDTARHQPLGLKNNQRQHHDCHRLVRQSKIDRHLAQQRKNAKRRLQDDRRQQPPGAAGDDSTRARPDGK